MAKSGRRGILKYIVSEWRYRTAELREEEHREWESVAKNIRHSGQGAGRPETVLKTPSNVPFILSWLRHFFLILHFLSPTYWLSQTQSRQEKIKKELDFKPYREMDAYLMAWLVLEILAAVVMGLFHMQWLVLAIIFSYRLLDIFQSWVNQFLLSNKWSAINVNRSLIVAFICYFEVVVIGAVIRFTFDDSPERTFSNSLASSVNTMIANPSQPASPIQYVQIMFAVLFAAVVVQHVVGRLSNKNGGEYD